VETLIARGASLPAIVAKINLMFGDDESKKLNRAGLQRHKAHHMGTDLVESLKVKSLGAILGKGVTLDELRTQESENLLAHIVAYRAELDTDIASARSDGNYLAVSSLVGRRTRLLEVVGRLLGELGISTVVNNVSLRQSPDFLELRRVLMEILKNYPDARRAVAAGMAELGRRKPEPEIIDITATEISGAERGVAIASAQAATTAEVVPLPAAVRSVPAIIRTEEYVDGRTSE
jgi:hypothetical protein